MLHQDLKKFGFPKNLARVYEALYKQGEAKAKDIIKETDLHRNIVYNNLDKLIEKDLATKKKEGHVTVFQALNPERIKKEIKRKEKLADNIVEELKAIREPQEQRVIFREGLEELKERMFELYENMEKNEQWKILGQSRSWFESVLDSEELEELREIQKEKSFKRKVATSEIIEQERKHQESLPELNEHKILPEFTSRENEIHIFEDKIINTILVEPYTIMEIKNPKVVESYNTFFERLWNQEVFTYKGWQEVKNVHTDIISPALEGNETYRVFISLSKDEDITKKANQLFSDFEQSWKDKKSIDRKMICFSDREYELVQERSRQNGILDRTEIRKLPEEYYSVLDMAITNQYVVVSEISETPKSTIYQSQNVIDGYKRRFDLLWNIAEKS
ncbi:MAG: helix-turn-helix domain-containing protein [Candidatus Magasanikbacteria bacterium]